MKEQKHTAILQELQFMLLNETKAWFDKDGFIKPNPFCNRNREYVLSNIKLAKMVYNDLYKYSIIPSWCRLQADKLSIPESQICSALELGKIKPFPNFQEMHELII